MENFTTTHIIIIFIFLTIFVFSLGMYLGVLLTRLKQQKVKEVQIKKALQINNEEKEKFFKDSIITIARATVQKQCELSEACIRIKKLLEHYPDIETKEEFLVIQNMYQDLSEFDYLESRNQLSKQEKFKQDNKRFKVEQDYTEKMHKSLNLLIEHFSTNH